MPVKFLEITSDPYKNNSNEFILIFGIAAGNYATPTAPGSGGASSGVISNPNGVTVCQMFLANYQDYEVTGSLSDEAFAHTYLFQNLAIIPPGWSFSSFTAAYGIQGTLEELAPFITGM